MNFACFLKDDQVVCFVKIQVWLFLVKNKRSIMLMVANDCLLCMLEVCGAGLFLFSFSGTDTASCFSSSSDIGNSGFCVCGCRVLWPF